MMTTRDNTAELDDRAQALLDALNELFIPDWAVVQRVEHGRTWCCYELIIDVPGREPYEFQRHIQPSHINGEPFRTALKFADEICERFGRYSLLRPDDAQG